MIVVGLLIVAVQAGIESGISLWGYVFLSAGRGLPQRIAGLTVSAYWSAIFIGRILLGAIARELVSTAVMAVPGSGLVAATGMIVVGLAAAPVFPLLTLTTSQRVGEDHATRTVTYQVAGSAAGGAGPRYSRASTTSRPTRTRRRSLARGSRPSSQTFLRADAAAATPSPK